MRGWPSLQRGGGISLALLACCLAACAGAPVAAQVASIKVNAKMVDRGVVVIDSVTMPHPGLLVVRAEPPHAAPIAVVVLRSGVTLDLRVAISRPARSGECLFVSLHADRGVAGTFERRVDPLLASGEVCVR